MTTSPIRLGGPVVFNVYTSQDAIQWTPLAAGARTQFILPLSLWEVTFVATTTRYMKLVSFNLAPSAAHVTELQAFIHTSFAVSETRRTNVFLSSGTGTASLKPRRNFTLGYSGSFNSIRQRAEAHDEVSTGIGFYEANPFLRMKKAGYSYSYATEVIGDIGSTSSTNTCVGDLLNTVYHAASMLSRVNEAGGAFGGA